MAEDKKSFVLYSDLESNIDLLTDDEAGRLFRHILAYVNDKNPEFKKDDRLLAVSFEPIKQQLKRDLKKYETIKIKRAEAGRKGGTATQNKSEQKPAIADQEEAKQANALLAKQTKANQADNVNDNGSDTVNVNDNVKTTFFYLRGNPHQIKISEYLESHCKDSTDTWMMTLFRGMNKTEIYEILDIEFIGTQFTDENHLRNSFKSVGKNILESNKKNRQSQLSEEKLILGAKPKGAIDHGKRN